MQPTHMSLMERLVENIEAGVVPIGDTVSSIPVSSYISEERLERETAALFRRQPLILAHRDQLPEPGTCLRHTALDLPILLVHDREGEFHAFLNVCRHRGVTLVNEDGLCRHKKLVCPYHHWTYDLDGSLAHVTRPEAFPGLDRSKLGLVELPSEMRDGLLWVVPTPDATIDLDGFLGSINAEFADFDFASHKVYKHTVTERKTNWKLIIEAFSESYHVARLHQRSIGRFFKDGLSLGEHVGRHTRSITARVDVTELRDLPREEWSERLHVTPSYYLFPNVIMVLHPDYVSIVTLFPKGTDATTVIHTMLVPELPTTEKGRSHYDRSFELIDTTVFQSEDLWVCELTQESLRSGANDSFVVGGLEGGLVRLHEVLDEAMAAAETSGRASG